MQGFIHAVNAGISVLVATYQSFAGDSKVINKHGLEANFLGYAKSFMQALTEIRPMTDIIMTRISADFEVRPLSLNVTCTDSVQRLHQSKKTETPYLVLPQSVYTLSQFVHELAPAGKYNPGYAISQDGKAQALYLVVETKGYDSKSDISVKEKWKIDSARQFFKALQNLPELKEKGVQIHYQTKINGEHLAQLISSMK